MCYEVSGNAGKAAALADDGNMADDEYPERFWRGSPGAPNAVV